MKNIIKLTLIICFFLSLINCKPQKMSNLNHTVQLKRVWMLVEFKDYKREYLIQKQAFLDLTKNKSAVANLGCITQSFLYTIKNKSVITFKEGMKINMKCKEMNLDTDFAKSIVSMNIYYIKAKKLTLISNNNEKMIFVAQDWD